jgi:amidohydrolase
MSQKILDKIKALAAEYYSEAVLWRRHFHANPELAFDEYETAKYICARLDEIGVPYKKGIAKTGVVGIIEGKKPAGKVIALRSDMDALPINELKNSEFRSRKAGIMHACGHDVHMTCLLGAAKILNEIKSDLDGSIKLIFQPSEEKYPGGASVMIKEGVLKNPKPDRMFGQHVLPTLDCGKVGMKSGMYMASTDEIYITVKGQGGHAATPELNIDPILIAAHLIVALQQIVSRNATPSIPSVLSFGRVVANGRTNVIPDQVIIEGTFRTYSESWRAEAHKKITHLSETLAASMGGSCDVFIDQGYPFLVNDDETTRHAFRDAQDYLGKENVVELDIRMTAEDFAYYSQLVPSCYYRLGVRNEKAGITSNLHTASFDVDETSIEIGMGLMAWIAFKELKRK